MINGGDGRRASEPTTTIITASRPGRQPHQQPTVIGRRAPRLGTTTRSKPPPRGGNLGFRTRHVSRSFSRRRENHRQRKKKPRIRHRRTRVRPKYSVFSLFFRANAFKIFVWGGGSENPIRAPPNHLKTMCRLVCPKYLKLEIHFLT